MVIVQPQSLPLPIKLNQISQHAHHQYTENSATKHNHQFNICYWKSLVQWSW